MEKRKKVILGLKMPTDPRWVKLVEGNISEILTDHAWCEQKAATNAISIIVKFSEYPEVVEEMTKIALEEMEHFQMVYEKIKERTTTLVHRKLIVRVSPPQLVEVEFESVMQHPG